MSQDELWMSIALEEAKKAYDAQEVPVGAILVKDGEILSRAHNLVETLQDPTAHAELICIRAASTETMNWRLTGATLYVTLEPCSMCLGAILLARISRLVWGAPELRHGACGSFVDLITPKHPTHPSLEFTKGILEDKSRELLQQFFKERRTESKSWKMISTN